MQYRTKSGILAFYCNHRCRISNPCIYIDYNVLLTVNFYSRPLFSSSFPCSHLSFYLTNRSSSSEFCNSPPFFLLFLPRPLCCPFFPSHSPSPQPPNPISPGPGRMKPGGGVAGGAGGDSTSSAGASGEGGGSPLGQGVA